jgi:hypothetical protein
MPTIPTGTKLLLRGLTDYSGLSKTVTGNGTATASSAQEKFGLPSLYLDGGDGTLHVCSGVLSAS